MKTRPLIQTLTLLGACLLCGCQTGSLSAPQLAELHCAVPTVTALDETKEPQSKGGLEIAVVPALYKAIRVDRTTTTRVQPNLAEQLSLGVVTGLSGDDPKKKIFVEQVTTPILKAAPARLEFTVRINNKLDRVFRGQGAIVQFNVGGKLVPFGNTDYKEFVGGIIPPRNESEFKIFGPALDSIPDKGTIGIFLYDVVTATDVAGNTTAKQNYEWYFNYTTREAKDSGEIKRARGTLDLAEYQKTLAEEAPHR